MTDPTKQEWRRLYAAATAFARAEPWCVLDDEEPTAIQNPEDGEFGYAVVLGAAGLESGLALYLGAEGYEGYRRLHDGDVESGTLEAAINQCAATFMLADREHLDKADRAVIKKLGLRFRGHNAWPWFRSLRPGLLPWYLSGAEARFLALVLELIPGVADKVDSGELDPCSEDDPDRLLTLILSKEGWREEYRTPEPMLEVVEPVPDIAEREDVRRLATAVPRQEARWELALFRLSEAVEPEGLADRPYFPMAMMAVDTDRELIVGHDLLPGAHPSPRQQQDMFLKLLQGSGHCPTELRIETPEYAEVLAPITRAVGINLEVRETPAASYIGEVMNDWFAAEWR